MFLMLSLLPSPFAQDKPDKVALLVGINAYGSEAVKLGEERSACRPPDVPADEFWKPLQGTHNDVVEMTKALEAQGFQVTPLLDCQATKKGIQDAFQRVLVDGVDSKDDIAVFYFSGHGHQVTDISGDEVDKLDEALVPYDNLGVRDGRGHLTDDELEEMLGTLTKKTDNAVTIIDACNSGTVTRGKDQDVRGNPVPAELTQPQAPSDGAVPDDGSGFLGRGAALSNGAILLTAARAEEPALEKDFEVGDGQRVRMGVLTYLLLQALNNAPPHMTWRGLVDNIRVRTMNLGISQVPQLEGTADKLLFNGAIKKLPRAWSGRVLRNGELKVAAGSLHGLAVGDELAIFNRGLPPKQMNLAEARKVTVTRVELDAAFTSLQGVTVSKKEKRDGLNVQLARPASPLFIPRFDITRLDPASRAVVKRELKTMTDIVFVEEEIDFQPNDVVIASDDDGESIYLLTGDPARRISIPTSCGEPVVMSLRLDDQDFGPLLRQALDLYAMRARIMQIQNTVQSLKRDIELQLLTVDGQPLLTSKPQPVLYPEERYQLQVTNRSDETVFFAIVELRSDGGTQTLYPDPAYSEGRDESELLAGKSESITLMADPAVGVLGWKVIALDKYVDFFGLEKNVSCRERGQQGAPAAVDYLKRGESKPDDTAADVGDPELKRLFDAGLKTRSSRVVVVNTGWGTDFIEIRIAEPGS